MEEPLYDSSPEAIWLDRRMAILARDPRLDDIPVEKYLELFWEAIGFFAGTALSDVGLDELSIAYLHSLLDRLELEVM
jgi:hypothetical protein